MNKIFIVSPFKTATTTIGCYLENFNLKDYESITNNKGCGFEILWNNNKLLNNFLFELPININNDISKNNLDLIQYTNEIIKEYLAVENIPLNIKNFIEKYFFDIIKDIKDTDIFSDSPMGHCIIDPLIKKILFAKYNCKFIFIDRNLDKWANSVYKWTHPFISPLMWNKPQHLNYKLINDSENEINKAKTMYINSKNRFMDLMKYDNNFLLFNIELDDISIINKFLDLPNDKNIKMINCNVNPFNNELWFINSNLYRLENRITKNEKEYDLIKAKINEILFNNYNINLNEYCNSKDKYNYIIINDECFQCY